MWPFNRRQSGQEQRSIEGWPWPYWPWNTGGPPPYERVDIHRALTLPPIFAACRLLADSIASMPPILYRSGKEGVPQQLSTPSLFVQPSLNGTLFDWLHRAVHSMALHGEAIGVITARDYYGFPTMVEWLNPQEVEVHDHQPSGPGSYMDPRWFWRGRPMNREDVVHIPWHTEPWRVRGFPPIRAFQITANIGLGAQEFSSAWFHNGGVPPGVLKNTTQKVKKEDGDILARMAANKFQSRQPLILGMDWEYSPIAIKPNEAQFTETMQMVATHVANMYGIPPEKIGGKAGGSLTYNSVAQNSTDFLTNSLRPWLVRFENALSNLFPRGQFVRFDTTELLRTDPLTKAQIDQICLGYYPPAWKSIDEVRQGNYLPPIPADQLPPMYRPAGGAVPGEPADPAPAAPLPPLPYGGSNGDHPVNGYALVAPN